MLLDMSRKYWMWQIEAECRIREIALCMVEVL